MSATHDPANLDRLLREAEEVRRTAEEVAARYRAALAERRRLSRGSRPELAAGLRALLAAPRPERPPMQRAAAPPAAHNTDIARETDNLARAERHLAEGEERVERQREMVIQLRRDGHDTARAEALLAQFLRTLDAWQTHRNAVAGAVSSAQRRHATSPAAGTRGSADPHPS